tara:strand:+ start:1418 stop:2062 length:645 start_codon:yes stop_codon:yes gene_type:complete
MLKSIEQKDKKQRKDNKRKLSRKSPQIVLATASSTRIEMFKKTGIPFLYEKHNVDEEAIKREKYSKRREKVATSLSIAKARSIQKKYLGKIIIGSDQILICENKLMSKAINLDQAEKNLNFLCGKKHELWSSTVAINHGKLVFSTLEKAEILFIENSRHKIKNYVRQKKDIILTSVGCYRIEDNNKYGLIKILSGSEETIKGFPIETLIKTLDI